MFEFAELVRSALGCAFAAGVGGGTLIVAGDGAHRQLDTYEAINRESKYLSEAAAWL